MEHVKVPADCNLTLEKSAILTRYGFGYDCSTDDYKIVSLLVTPFSCDELVRVFLLKTGVWKELVRGHGNCFSQDLILNWSSGCFLNGVIYWLAIDRETGKLTIDAFNLAKEAFRQLPCLVDHSSCGRLLILGGFFCV